MFSGSHDITHCSLQFCPRSSTCIRYLAHLSLEALLLEQPDKPMRTAYLSDPEAACASNNFSMYWKDSSAT